MTPLGHISIGYIIAKKTKIVTSAILIGSVFPDIDFLFIFFPWFNNFHRGFTHGIFFLGIIILILYFRGYRKNYITSFSIGFLLHILVDSSMDANISNGIGVAIFSPFSNECYSLFNLFDNLNLKSLTWEKPLELIYQTFSLFIWEIPFIIISLIIWFQNLIQRRIIF